MDISVEMLSGVPRSKKVLKRSFDIIFSFIGLMITLPIIFIAWLAATCDTGMNGFFLQDRVGRYGMLFKVIKIRTMRPDLNIKTTVTTSEDPRITIIGKFLRKTKIDELPQLINVLIGDMSFVGPRPDVPGFADRLKGDDRIILTVRPGITGPASLAYRNEEEMLLTQEDPERYNREVIFPDKVRINKKYIEDCTIYSDIKYIFLTIFK